MANALGTLFSEIAGAIREKSGETGKMKPIEFPEKIRGISGGGSADVRYVTFMSYDGSVEYGKIPVAVGYDCPTPKFADPTRESTAQYNYTFYGWADTPNGGANASWNKNITEDKTVYANFASALRYYTINFYDGDTVLKTETLAYGAMPSYVPEKKGFNFEGWEPTIVSVTGDASYHSQWSKALTFSGASWEDIAQVCADGKASSTFSVGDTKDVVLTDESGNTQTITVAIAGFNHDDLADGTGKASMSVVCLTVPTKYIFWWSGSLSAGTPYMYYKTPSSHAASKTSDLYTALQPEGTIWNYLPEGLKAIIKPALKKNPVDFTPTSTIASDPEYLWPLSATELSVAPINSTDEQSILSLGEPYPLFANNESLKAVTASGGSSATSYWLRDIYCGGDISRSGPIYYNGTAYTVLKWTKSGFNYNSYRARFGFCI